LVEHTTENRSVLGSIPSLAIGKSLQIAGFGIAAPSLLVVPNQLGVEYNAHLLRTIAREIAPALGWAPKDKRRVRA
jgi:hypothetical protein